MSQVLLLLLFFCVSIDTAIIQWTGIRDNSWWNEANWNCDRDLCLPTSEDDVVISPTQICPSCVQHVVLGLPQAECRSLRIQSDNSFKFSLDVLGGLAVGSGGIHTDTLSVLYVFGKLWSVGNVQADGTFSVQSGTVYGTGNYSVHKLIASTCFLYAHVKVSTDLIVEPQAPGLADAIMVQSNGSLTVSGNLLTDNPITISGNLNINASVIFSSRDPSYRYVLTGNLPQTFGSINISSGLLVVTTPITTRSLIVGASAAVQLNVDSNIGNASGSGMISVLSGNTEIEVIDTKLQISSTGRLVLIGNSVGTITITGGNLITNLKGGNIFNFNNLTVVRGNLQLSTLSVKQLFLGDGVILYKGSINVTTRAISTGAITIYGSIIVIEKGATFEQVNGVFQMYGDLQSDVSPVFINEGRYLLKGDLKTYAYISGSGEWNMDGSWFMGVMCDITGTVDLIGNTTLTFDSQYFSYKLGTVRGGGLFSGIGSFTAKDLSVNWFDEQFSELTVDNVSVMNYYNSRCCGLKKIGVLSTELLDLEPGNHPFTVGKGIIDTVKLFDGVNLGFEQSADLTNLEFSGGSLSSNGSLTVSVRNTTTLSSDSLKVIMGDTILETAILDCRACSNPTCNLDGWRKIKAATTRGICAIPANLLG